MNTALLAFCIGGDIASDTPVIFGGHFLSIYETSDIAGSCLKIAERSTEASFEEIAISTGEKHGAFYQPLPAWIQPLKAWIKQATGNVCNVPEGC